MKRHVLNLLAASLVVSVAGCTLPESGGAALAESFVAFLEFARRLDTQARAYHRDTGTWPRHAADLQGEYAAALGPVSPRADLRLIRFHPNADGTLVIELRPTDRSAPEDVLYVGSDGETLWQLDAVAVEGARRRRRN